MAPDDVAEGWPWIGGKKLVIDWRLEMKNGEQPAECVLICRHQSITLNL